MCAEKTKRLITLKWFNHTNFLSVRRYTNEVAVDDDERGFVWGILLRDGIVHG